MLSCIRPAFRVLEPKDHVSTAPDLLAEPTSYEDAKPPFLRRVQIRGYKSIAFCDVTLEPLTILVGRNASGKSNFLDALAFVRDAMATNIPEAVKRHGGWHSMLSRHAADKQISFEFEVAITHPDMGEVVAIYGFVLHVERSGVTCLITENFNTKNMIETHSTSFSVSRHAGVTSWAGPDDLRDVFYHFQDRPDQLSLGLLANQSIVNIGDGFRHMGFYNFNPGVIRIPQKPSPGTILEADGSNLASLIPSVEDIDHDTITRVKAYLSAVVNEVKDFRHIAVGGYDTLQFQIAAGRNAEVFDFDAGSMSDGTLRVLACLMAAFQVQRSGGPSVVGIEEPETSLHPAAMRALVDALDEAALRTQVLLTTHSADLLDNPTIRPENVRVVEMIDGRTIIAPVDAASVEIVRRKLNTLGGLERDDQLRADLDDLDRQSELSGNMQEPGG